MLHARRPSIRRAARLPLVVTRVGAGAAFALLILGCGGGGGGGGGSVVTPEDFSGTWHVSASSDETACGGGAAALHAFEAVATQVGADLTILTPFGALSGVVQGTVATVSGSLAGVGYFDVYSSVQLTRSGDVITGAGPWVRSPSATGSPVTCAGSSTFELVPPLTLTGFNLPNVAGVAMNQPLVFTFSVAVDPATVTPDSMRITGVPSFTYDAAVVDGNLVALLPRTPTFDDLSDAGIAPGATYQVFLPSGAASDVVRSLHGAPLASAGSFTFQAAATPTFVEPRRALVHAPGPTSGPNGRGDEDGCINNPANEFYVFPGFQDGTDSSARLMCLINEGAPRIVQSDCSPRHDDRNVGTPSAVVPGSRDLPPIRIRFNEPMLPALVGAYVAGTQHGVNCQLWRVGDASANPIAITASNQVSTNKPILVQGLDAGGAPTSNPEAILVPSAPVLPGTYLVLVRGLTDLPGNVLLLTGAPDPTPGGYGAIEVAVANSVVPAGYRYYFRVP